MSFNIAFLRSHNCLYRAGTVEGESLIRFDTLFSFSSSSSSPSSPHHLPIYSAARFETLFAEVMGVTNDIVDAIDNLDKWAKPEKPWSGVAWASKYQAPSSVFLEALHSRFSSPNPLFVYP